MRQIYPDLWQTAEERRFGTLTTHAYLLERTEGNVLFYTSSRRDELKQVVERGPVLFQYLSHCHEVDDSLVVSRETLGAKLCCDALVEPYFSPSAGADVYFSAPRERERHSGNVEVIHTPGHTNNNVCYRDESPHGRTYLFVGDTLYQDQGAWKTLIVPSDGGSADALRKTLLLLRAVEADVVISSASFGETQIVEVTQAEWYAIIDPLSERLPR